MPNGGSDCCGTCWFNARNKGEAGYDHAHDPEPAHCTIRDLALDDPFYTYCGNHPHRRPDRDPIPIGPVFVGMERDLWQASPDTEEIRRHLLALLDELGGGPSPEYPMGAHSIEIVVWQLGEFREPRAIEGLRRIALATGLRNEGELGVPGGGLGHLAREALAKIERRGL